MVDKHVVDSDGHTDMKIWAQEMVRNGHADFYQTCLMGTVRLVYLILTIFVADV